MADLKDRPIGATATLGKTGYPAIRSVTGGELEIVTGPTQPGFNPLDLLLASLAACMSMSARIAAREIGLARSAAPSFRQGAAVGQAGQQQGQGKQVFHRRIVPGRAAARKSPIAPAPPIWKRLRP